jgi:two-component system chemotaxis response regulator CheB
MASLRPIRVVIVDDSLLFREMLARGLNDDPGIEIIATVSDANKALSVIEEMKPDVVTMDIEMPGMNGIDFVKKLLPIYPVPVIMVSSIDSRVFEAMSAGALDFVLKPSASNMGSKGFLNELAVKVKIAASSKIGYLKQIQNLPSKISSLNTGKVKVVAIGASTGGTEAILRVVQDLPVDVPGVVIVQHIPPVFSKMFADRLNNLCQLRVKEAVNGDEVTRGSVLIAPGDKHMKVVRRNGKIIVECREGEKVSGHCPSVDVLFTSISLGFRDDAIGVILTGMGSDGAKGLLSMRRNGSFTIGQDEKTSVVYGMPMEAYKIGAVAKQAALNNIPDLILNNI